MKEKDVTFNNILTEVSSKLSPDPNRDVFIEPSEIETFLSEFEQIKADAEKRSKKILFKLGLVNKELKKNTIDFLELYNTFRQNASDHNSNLALKLSKNVGERINPVEGRNLDTQQLSSIAMDVKTRLVIAGAGTGKTTTIIGLVKELLISEKAKPEEILLLSFTNASVNELKQRILKETSKQIDTTTFHRLGLRIIASSKGTVPKISKTDLVKFITETLTTKKKDRNYIKKLNDYLLTEQYSKDESSFNSKSEYQRYRDENPFITLNGESVKSNGEADIANYLAMNGISYTYEDSYMIDTNNGNHGQYHPDFHINDTNVYIEYFGIDRNGHVGKFILDDDPGASEKYIAQMKWKETLHAENGTKLISLYSYNRFEGTLLDDLKNKLILNGIKLNPISDDELFSKAVGNDNMKISTMISMFSTAIILIKGSGKPWDQTFPVGNNRNEEKSLKKLEGVLKPLYDAYQNNLKDKNEIDFEDMLTYASACVKEGYLHPYKYVIVDEYQDISQSRYNLLRAMRDSKDYRLFCVGDDWQSIYRFNGSNVSYILDFEYYWGLSEICKIENTYRFSGELLKKSSEFICRNPRQFKKELKGMGKNQCFIYTIKGSNERHALQNVAKKIERLPYGESILFLGRYKHDVVGLGDVGFTWKPVLGNDGSISVSYETRPDLKMTFMTVHGSKGLQADYVFILNNKTGNYGFPSLRGESPIISKLLNSEDTQIDEERRLFYVAMTRAKKALYLVATTGKESIFFKEIANVTSTKDDRGPYKRFCPRCGGEMVLRKGRFGEFYGCTNYLSKGCRYTIKK